MKKIIIILLVCATGIVFGQTRDNRITIGTKDSLYSKILKENRDYFVYLPKGYETKALDGYPVIYLLDGNDHFHSVSGLVQFLGSYSQMIPEMIVIAIPNTDRTRDLTPTHTTKMNGVEQDWLKTSGGNDAFLKFIQTELIPEVETKYRTKPYRIFIGHSFGGITAINALYIMPQTFNAYIAVDPSLWYDDQVLLKKARSYFIKTNLKGKALFISKANTLSPRDTFNNHFESISEFATLLETRNHSGLRWKYEYYPDDNHGSAPLITEYDGLRFIFENYPKRIYDVDGADQLKKMFADYSDQMGSKFLPPEEVINNLGYRFMNDKKYDQALQFFQMAIDSYPKSANVYDSMGELWMNKGDNKKAISYYEKSLMLNPNNEGAKANIKKLKETKVSGK